MRVKTLHKINYSQACRQAANSNNRNQTSLNSNRFVKNPYNSNFPRLLSTSSKSPVSYRSIFKIQNVVQDMQTADIETAELDKVNFCSDLMFGKPLYFVFFYGSDSSSYHH